MASEVKRFVRAPLTSIDFSASCLSTDLEVWKESGLSNVPEGWTDDMNIVVGEGRTLEQLVEDVFDR